MINLFILECNITRLTQRSCCLKQLWAHLSNRTDWADDILCMNGTHYDLNVMHHRQWKKTLKCALKIPSTQKYFLLFGSPWRHWLVSVQSLSLESCFHIPLLRGKYLCNSLKCEIVKFPGSVLSKKLLNKFESQSQANESVTSSTEQTDNDSL